MYTTQREKINRIGAIVAALIAVAAIAGLGWRWNRTARLEPDKFRIESAPASGSAVGTLQLSANWINDEPVPFEVRHDYGQFKTSVSGTPGKVTLTAQPTSLHGQARTELVLTTSQVVSERQWFGLLRRETRTTGAGSGTVGTEPFRWTAQPDVYPRGEPLTVAYVGEAPITVMVGDPASK